MKRAALLPAGGDPYVTAYWLRHYEQLWAREVDVLRIIVCGQNEPAVQDYLRRKAAAVPHCEIEFEPARTDHGAMMHRLLDASRDADEVVFLEDDAFVRYPSVVDARFRRIEDGEIDVVGTARTNCTPNLQRRTEELYGGQAPYLETGESGWSLYPCFLFARQADLRRAMAEYVELNPGNPMFSASHFTRGMHIKALDYTVTQEEGADTFTEATWYLRYIGLRLDGQAAYRSDNAHRDIGNAPWFHVGSLSAGYGATFMSNMDPKSYQTVVESIRPRGEIIDWHKRFSWWTRVLDCADDELPDFKARYRAELEKFMSDVWAEPAEIARWRSQYDALVTWREKA